MSAQSPTQIHYRGRFAPSPTGSLHLGSLYTALASFLQARSQQGQWLIRIDDLDTPRNVAGAASDILKTLEAFGLTWDEAVFYQSQQLETYQAFIAQLSTQQRFYPCTCSRKMLAAFQSESNPVYPGFCRDKTLLPSEPYALRMKTEAVNIDFNDFLQGQVCQNIARQHGDFVIQRKDQIIAYQFAVVIDDYQQRITEVVRGFDLLDCTPQQIYLHQLFGLTPPAYMHVPILTDRHGQKLSKQSYAPAVDVRNPADTLFYLLTLLKQQPPMELYQASVAQLLNWAIENWQAAALKTINTRKLFEKSSNLVQH